MGRLEVGAPRGRAVGRLPHPGLAAQVPGGGVGVHGHQQGVEVTLGHLELACLVLGGDETPPPLGGTGMGAQRGLGRQPRILQVMQPPEGLRGKQEGLQLHLRGRVAEVAVGDEQRLEGVVAAALHVALQDGLGALRGRGARVPVCLGDVVEPVEEAFREVVVEGQLRGRRDAGIAGARVVGGMRRRCGRGGHDRNHGARG